MLPLCIFFLNRYLFFYLQELSKATELKIGSECKSSDKKLGEFGSLDECINACKDDNGCKYFIYGTGSKKGKCYREFVTSTRQAQQKGWERDQYNFYELK